MYQAPTTSEEDDVSPSRTHTPLEEQPVVGESSLRWLPAALPQQNIMAQQGHRRETQTTGSHMASQIDINCRLSTVHILVEPPHEEGEVECGSGVLVRAPWGTLVVASAQHLFRGGAAGDSRGCMAMSKETADRATARVPTIGYMHPRAHESVLENSRELTLHPDHRDCYFSEAPAGTGGGHGAGDVDAEHLDFAFVPIHEPPFQDNDRR
jgi:hypothetical protein